MRYFLDIAYKGTDYHGWQIQPNARTVQEELQKALSTILRKPIEVTGSGRTDTGVHARQQVVHFDFPEKLSYRIHGFKLNALLPKDISVKDLFQVKDEAHARFDAIERAYRYQIS